MVSPVGPWNERPQFVTHRPSPVLVPTPNLSSSLRHHVAPGLLGVSRRVCKDVHSCTRRSSGSRSSPWTYSTTPTGTSAVYTELKVWSTGRGHGGGDRRSTRRRRGRVWTGCGAGPRDLSRRFHTLPRSSVPSLPGPPSTEKVRRPRSRVLFVSGVKLVSHPRFRL